MRLFFLIVGLTDTAIGLWGFDRIDPVALWVGGVTVGAAAFDLTFPRVKA